MTTIEDMSGAENIIAKLEKEGFGDIQIVKMKQMNDAGEHSHEKSTVHIIMLGELVIVDATGTKTHRKGERVEFPAGTRHRAKSGPKGLIMIVGTK